MNVKQHIERGDFMEATHVSFHCYDSVKVSHVFVVLLIVSWNKSSKWLGVCLLKVGMSLITHQNIKNGYGLALTNIHTLQLNFLFSDWLFSKYAECIENVHCTPQTARGAFGAWSRVWTSQRLIHFFHWVKLLIFFMFSWILEPFYL